MALPAYRAAPGCLGARLLLGGREEEGGARGGSVKRVGALTEWESETALEAAAGSAQYLAAMETLGSYFKGVPEVRVFASEGADAFFK